MSIRPPAPCIRQLTEQLDRGTGCEDVSTLDIYCTTYVCASCTISKQSGEQIEVDPKFVAKRLSSATKSDLDSVLKEGRVGVIRSDGEYHVTYTQIEQEPKPETPAERRAREQWNAKVKFVAGVTSVAWAAFGVPTALAAGAIAYLGTKG